MRAGTIVIAAVAILVAMPAAAQQPGSFDELRNEISALADRLDQLEAENARLKARNDQLEKSTIANEENAAADPRLRGWYESTKISGYAMSDAYGVLSHHDPEIDGDRGFWLRRAYLTFDSNLGGDWSSRLRFEMSSPGDFSTNAKMNPVVKDAYLSWKHGSRQLYLGISPTPTWDLVEKHWGYRSVEKTAMDLYRMGSSRDFGVSYKGKSDSGKVFYEMMLGNGSSNGAETNEGKKAMLSVGFRPTDTLVVQLYGDVENRPGNTDRTTFRGFVGLDAGNGRAGFEYAVQQRDLATGGSADVAIASAFGSMSIGDKSALLARWDRSSDGFPDTAKIPYVAIAPDMKFDMALLGWDYIVKDGISIIPNLQYFRYRDTNGVPAPDSDLYGKITLYYKF